MNLAQKVINNINLNESEIPNKYKYMVEDIYLAGDGYWVIDLVDGYSTSYGTNYIRRKTRKEAISELDLVSKNEELNEDSFDNWQYQIDLKFQDELEDYLKKLYNKLHNYNEHNIELKSKDFYELLKKIDYIENKLGIKPKIGRELH